MKNKKTNTIIDNLTKTPLAATTLNELIKLQNEIGVSFSTKITAVMTINNDELAAAFAKAYAYAYAEHGLKTLIIDANMYNPSFNEIFKNQDGFLEISEKGNKDHFSTSFVDAHTNAISLNKEIYPSEIFKSGVVQKLIENNHNSYDHFVVLVPSIKDHKEIILLKDVLTAIILVVQKNVSKKEHIFNAIQYCKENELPLAKTVVLK